MGAIALLMGILGSPDGAASQVCEGSCEVCGGGGHSYGVSGEKAKGYTYHSCGNGSACGGGINVHNACDGDATLPGYIQRQLDAQDLLRYESLSGLRLRAIVALSDGRLYLNVERGAIQQFDCKEKGLVVAHLPLSPQQLEEFQLAEQVVVQSLQPQ